MNLINLFEKSAEDNPGAIAIRHPSGEITYGVLLDAVRRLTGGLKRKGVGSDSRVALIMPNIPHYIISYLSVMRVGAVVVPIDFGLSEYEMLPMLEEAEIDTVICWSGDLKVVDAAANKLPLVKRLIVLGEGKPTQSISLTRLISQSQPDFEPTDLDDDDIGVIRMGNGRSGRPIASEFSHSALSSNAIAVRDTLEIKPQDTIFSIIPLCETAAQGLVLNLFIASGCSIALAPGASVINFRSDLRSNGASIFVGYPSHFHALVNLHIDEAHSPTLRLSLCTGGELNEDVLKEFEKHYGGYTLECYTLRDAGPVVAINKWRTGRRVGSLGHPLPGIEMRVISDNGKECSIGEIGEIVVKGGCGMRNYSGRPRLTNQNVSDRWIKSEDYGRMDINGFFYYSGNDSDRFDMEGKSFYIHEVEKLINLHPGVSDAAVVVTTDDLGVQKLKACIVPVSSEDFAASELKSYLLQYLSNYKCPDMIRIYKDLPRMVDGEIDREELSGFVKET